MNAKMNVKYIYIRGVRENYIREVDIGHRKYVFQYPYNFNGGHVKTRIIYIIGIISFI